MRLALPGQQPDVALQPVCYHSKPWCLTESNATAANVESDPRTNITAMLAAMMFI